MLDRNHRNFLGKFFKADEHYTKEEAPIQWLKNSKTVTHQDIDEALNDSDRDVRYQAIRHPNATKEHINKALNDSTSYVRSYAIKLPNVTRENLLTALADSDYSIRTYARRHPRYKEYFPNGHRKHSKTHQNDAGAFKSEVSMCVSLFI